MDFEKFATELGASFAKGITALKQGAQSYNQQHLRSNTVQLSQFANTALGIVVDELADQSILEGIDGDKVLEWMDVNSRGNRFIGYFGDVNQGYAVYRIRLRGHNVKSDSERYSTSWLTYLGQQALYSGVQRFSSLPLGFQVANVSIVNADIPYVQVTFSERANMLSRDQVARLKK